jgi:hypothetical protein
MIIENSNKDSVNVLNINYAFFLFQNFFFVPLSLIVGLEFLFALKHPTNLIFDLLLWFALLIALTTIPLIILAILEQKKKMGNTRNINCIYCENREDVEYRGYPSFFDIFLLPVCNSHHSQYIKEIEKLYHQEKNIFIKLYIVLFLVNLLIDIILVILMTLIYIMTLLNRFPYQLGGVVLLILTIVPFLFQLVFFFLFSVRLYSLLRKIETDAIFSPIT